MATNRCINATGRTFAGIVVGTLRLLCCQQLSGQINLGAQDNLIGGRTHGQLIARLPEPLADEPPDQGGLPMP